MQKASPAAAQTMGGDISAATSTSSPRVSAVLLLYPALDPSRASTSHVMFGIRMRRFGSVTLTARIFAWYSSAVSSPSNATGIAAFDSIGLFDLPDDAIFQVFRRRNAHC
jgi:hypothetical protein